MEAISFPQCAPVTRTFTHKAIMRYRRHSDFRLRPPMRDILPPYCRRATIKHFISAADATPAKEKYHARRHSPHIGISKLVDADVAISAAQRVTFPGRLDDDYYFASACAPTEATAIFDAAMKTAQRAATPRRPADVPRA